MKLLIGILMILFCSCTEQKTDIPAKQPKQIIKIEKLPENPKNPKVIKSPVKPAPADTVSLDPLEKLEIKNSADVAEVNFKLLTDFDLPLEDQKFAEETDLKSLREAMPAAVKRLNKKIIRIKGFMVPLALNEDNKVSSFLFAPDQYSCCFGRIPDLNGFIYCTSEKGLPNLKDINIELTGYFKSEPEYNVFDEAVYLYTMKAHDFKELSLKIPLKGKGPDFDF